MAPINGGPDQRRWFCCWFFVLDGLVHLSNIIFFPSYIRWVIDLILNYVYVDDEIGVIVSMWCDYHDDAL